MHEFFNKNIDRIFFIYHQAQEESVELLKYLLFLVFGSVEKSTPIFKYLLASNVLQEVFFFGGGG